MEHQSIVQELDLICNATQVVVNIMKGKTDAAMTYDYVVTLQGQETGTEGMYTYGVNNSMLGDVEIWQLQLKFLFRTGKWI